MAALLRKGLQLKVVMQPAVAAVAVAEVAPVAATAAGTASVAAIALVSGGDIGEVIFYWGWLVREKSDLSLEIDIFWYMVFKL